MFFDLAVVLTKSASLLAKAFLCGFGFVCGVLLAAGIGAWIWERQFHLELEGESE